MIGAITEELRAALPEIISVIDEAGQNVTVARPGQPDVVVRAVVYQMDDNSRAGDLADPEVKVIPWQGIFKPDAPLRELPFTVITASGLVLTPDGPAQDPADQGVALIAHLLPLEARTRVESLTFTIPGVGLVKNPVNGNDMPAPGTLLTLPARLTATADPRIRDTVGADSAEVVLIGRWGSLSAPRTRPLGVKWGSKTPLTLDGQPGTLTIKLAYPDADLATEEVYGARFLCTWTAGK